MRKEKKELLKELLCEFLASMFVQVIGCSVTKNFGDIPHALAWGGAVAAATQAFRIISGAHINPCITIAAMILRIVEFLEGCLYIIFQLIGSACGFGISYLLFQNSDFKGNVFCACVVQIDPWWKGILLEIFMTGAWVLAMCSTWNYSNVSLLESVSLRIGLVVAVCHLAGVSFKAYFIKMSLFYIYIYKY